MSPHRKLRTVVVVLILIILLGGIWGALNHQRQNYAAEWLRKVHPSVPPLMQVRSQSPGPARCLLLLGDSRVAEWGLPEIPGWRVVNAGIPGLTTSELVLVARGVLLEYRPQTVFIQAGVNELKVLGVRGDLNESLISLCESNLLKVARMATEQGATVLLTPVWPTGKVPWQRWLVWDSRIPEALAEVNRRLEQAVAKEGQVQWFDVVARPTARSVAAPQPVEPRHRDTLHLAPEFYQDLTERLSLELRK